MYKYILVAVFLTTFATAQTKKPAGAGKNPKPAVAQADSAKPAAPEVIVIPKNFAVYSRKPKQKSEKMKLCVNLVKDTTILNYCISDSICRDPEVAKILFQETSGDTTYVLVYVDAFSKPADKPSCDAGHEVKLFFARWNTKTNKAVWKNRNIASCMRGITNMSKEPIKTWDGTTVLNVNYYRGGSDFIDLHFDPQNYKLGLQSGSVEQNTSESESK